MESSLFKVKFEEDRLNIGVVWRRKDLISTSHTIKDVSVLDKGRLNLIHKDLNVRVDSVCKDFGDDLDDDIEETNTPELINIESPFFGMRAIKA